MMNFEYLLRYYLNSSTLKLKNVKKIENGNTNNEYFKRYSKNECFFGLFQKKDANSNTIVPLLNLPIDFRETEHILFYGYVCPGKTIYAEKKYSLGFKPNDNFDNFIVFDPQLETIADYEEKEEDVDIELSEISESKETNELDKDFKNQCGIDTSKAKMRLQQILEEYKHLGYNVNDDNDGPSEMEEFQNDFKPDLHADLSNSGYNNDLTGLNNNEKQNDQRKNDKNIGFVSDKNENMKEIKAKHKSNNKNVNGEDFTTIVDREVNIRKFSYVIKESDRVLPLYELSFKFDINLELKSKKGNVCERCEKHEATMFCVAERAAFCTECDEKIHFDSFTRRHVRHYYSNLGKKQKFFNCLHHPNTVVDYFCEECQIPLCTDCRLRENHPMNHHLITYFEADESANRLKQKNFDPQIRKNEKCIESLRNEVYKFRKNISEVELALEKQYIEIKKELEIFKNKKYQIFNAKYLEYWQENRSMVFTHDFVNVLDNSEIIKNYPTILIQQNLQIREEFRAKYRNIFLHGSLSIQKHETEGFRKNRQSNLNKTKEFYAESSDTRVDRF